MNSEAKVSLAGFDEACGDVSVEFFGHRAKFAGCSTGKFGTRIIKEKLHPERLSLIPNLSRSMLRNSPKFGDGPNTVSESTVSDTELSESLWPSPSFGERIQ